MTDEQYEDFLHYINVAIYGNSKVVGLGDSLEGIRYELRRIAEALENDAPFNVRVKDD